MSYNVKGETRNTGRTHFKKGFTPWNKGIKTGLIPKTAFKPNDERLTGTNSKQWKGDQVGYFGLHLWVSKHKGKAKKCRECGSDNNVQWANKSHEYKRDLSDWLELCRRCHMKYDQVMDKAWKTRKAHYA